MAYPLIVLGAGASADFAPMARRAPLTKDLVSHDYSDIELLKKYGEAASLLEDIGVRMDAGAPTFEKALEAIKIQSGHQQHRKRQFIDLAFYLKDLFDAVSGYSFHPRNSHKTLINKIRDAGGRACVVSFNYDSLFERSLTEGGFSRMKDYIGSDIKVIKPHGSHDWVYFEHPEYIDFQWHQVRTARDFLLANPDYFETRRKNGGNPYHIEELKNQRAVTFPAIAIPLPEKQDMICPELHLNVLKRELESIDRILIIGWRAADPALMEMLFPVIQKRNIPVGVVSGEDSLPEVKNIFESIKKSSVVLGQVGYRNFLGNDASTDFFSN